MYFKKKGLIAMCSIVFIIIVISIVASKESIEEIPEYITHEFTDVDYVVPILENFNYKNTEPKDIYYSIIRDGQLITRYVDLNGDDPIIELKMGDLVLLSLYENFTLDFEFEIEFDETYITIHDITLIRHAPYEGINLNIHKDSNAKFKPYNGVRQIMIIESITVGETNVNLDYGDIIESTVMIEIQ